MLANSKQGEISKKYIAVLGTGSQCPESIVPIAQKIGEGIAERGAVVVCGGIGGIFKHVLKGANSSCGETIAITTDTKPIALDICNHIIATGMGTARHSIIANTCSGAIILGGWIGSLSLATNFLAQKKPVVAVKGTGGVADTYADKAIIEASDYKILSANNPGEVLSLLFNLLEEGLDH